MQRKVAILLSQLAGEFILGTDSAYSFKEVGLLQEHRNKDWVLITVYIFTLRKTVHTVQRSFDIPAYGERHTVPDMTAEIQKLADALRDQRIQEYVANSANNDTSNSNAVKLVRDLLEEGSMYADTRAAFKKFTPKTRKPENLGVVNVEEDPDDETMQLLIDCPDVERSGGPSQLARDQ
ncbi:hypothetical protein MSAN_00696100 [Mycena sanguinolenta]|uniref:Uncharacterized protein n=1 Tax=Mycena sanguinolenta TaxID=230812 RepID=A0A8H7DGK4_9AGAR|nr:hypothetical protein MSAN_00696100 [Mycena sanguinolenta]